MPNGLWVPLLAGVFGTLIGSIATITAALINRPTLASILDSRIVTLMQIYEKTIGELRMEIARLQEKIDIYERTVMELRDHIAQLEAKIDIMKARMAGGEPGLGAGRIAKLFWFCPLPLSRSAGAGAFF